MYVCLFISNFNNKEVKQNFSLIFLFSDRYVVNAALLRWIFRPSVCLSVRLFVCNALEL